MDTLATALQVPLGPGKIYQDSVLESEFSWRRHNSTNFPEEVLSLNFGHTCPSGSRYLIAVKLRDPIPATQGNGEIEEKLWPHGHTTPGHENWLAEKMRRKEKWMDSNLLAKTEASQKLQKISDMI